RPSGLGKVAMATWALGRVTPLENTAVTMPLASISTLVRLPKAVPLLVIDWVTDWLSSWVMPPVEPAPPLRFSVTVWAAMPSDGAQFTWQAPGAAALEAPKVNCGSVGLKATMPVAI